MEEEPSPDDLTFDIVEDKPRTAEVIQDIDNQRAKMNRIYFINNLYSRIKQGSRLHRIHPTKE